MEVALWALKHDVKIRTIQDPDTFRELLYAVVTGQRNNEDSKRKALASQAGRKRAIARGEYVGHLPDGYRLAKWLQDGELRKRMEIDPARQPVIGLMFRLALRGRTCGQIARTLNDRGWMTKPVKRIDRSRPFDVSKVYELLKNPRYAALATYKGEVLARDHWPAYISEREHRRIARQLTTPVRSGVGARWTSTCSPGSGGAGGAVIRFGSAPAGHETTGRGCAVMCARATAPTAAEPNARRLRLTRTSPRRC